MRSDKIVDEVEMMSGEVISLREMDSETVSQVETEYAEVMVGQEDATNEENNNDESNYIFIEI